MFCSPVPNNHRLRLSRWVSGRVGPPGCFKLRRGNTSTFQRISGGSKGLLTVLTDGIRDIPDRPCTGLCRLEGKGSCGPGGGLIRGRYLMVKMGSGWMKMRFGRHGSGYFQRWRRWSCAEVRSRSFLLVSDVASGHMSSGGVVQPISYRLSFSSGHKVRGVSFS
jgi:hypothetical protein